MEENNTPREDQDLFNYFNECNSNLYFSEDPAAYQARDYFTAAGIDLQNPNIKNRLIGLDLTDQPAIIYPATQDSYISEDLQTMKQTRHGNPFIFNADALTSRKESSCYVVPDILSALQLEQAGHNAIAIPRPETDEITQLIKNKEINKTLFIIHGTGGKGETGAWNQHSAKLLEERLKLQNIPNAVKQIPTATAADLYSKGIQDEFIKPAEGLRPDSMAAYIANNFAADLTAFKATKAITGFENLDKQIRNVYAGLYVLGALSSLGKTTFLHQMADQMAEAGNDILYFSLEQSRLELLTKSLTRHICRTKTDAKITSLKIRREFNPNEEQTEKDMQQAAKALEWYSEKIADKMNIIEGNFNCTVSFIREKVADYIALNSTSADSCRPIVFIDYLQVIQPEKNFKGSTKDAIDSIVTGIKRLSRDYQIPVFLISSFNRNNYLYPVSFESFKESGGIEYTADVILGLQLEVVNTFKDIEKNKNEYREKIKEAKAKYPREIQLVCLKNRFGISSFEVNFEYYPSQDLFM